MNVRFNQLTLNIKLRLSYSVLKFLICLYMLYAKQYTKVTLAIFMYNLSLQQATAISQCCNLVKVN